MFKLKSALVEVPEVIPELVTFKMEELVQSNVPKNLKTRIWLMDDNCVPIIGAVLTIYIADVYSQYTPIYIPGGIYRLAYRTYCDEILDKPFSVVGLHNKLKEYVSYYYRDLKDTVLDNDIWEQDNLIYIFESPTEHLNDNGANLRFLMFFRYLLERNNTETVVLEKLTLSAKFLRKYRRSKFKFKLVQKSETKIPFLCDDVMLPDPDIERYEELMTLLEETNGILIY